MKTFKRLSIVAVVLFAFTFASNAQGMKYVKIKTTAQSELCKATIEKSLKSEKGVEEAKVDMESKVVTVKYSEADTDYDKIKKVITDIGYSADEKKACSGTKYTDSKHHKSKCSGTSTKGKCCNKPKKSN